MKTPSRGGRLGNNRAPWLSLHFGMDPLRGGFSTRLSSPRLHAVVSIIAHSICSASCTRCRPSSDANGAQVRRLALDARDLRAMRKGRVVLLSLIARAGAVYDGNGAQSSPSNQFHKYANY